MFERKKIRILLVGTKYCMRDQVSFFLFVLGLCTTMTTKSSVNACVLPL